MSKNSYNEVKHPVVKILNGQKGKLMELGEELKNITWSSTEETEFIRTEYGSLADDVVGLEKFSLKPSDLIEIWSTVVDIFKNRHLRYKFAAMISGAFAVQVTTDPLWSTIPRAYHEGIYVLPDSLRVSSELVAYRKRLELVNANVDIASKVSTHIVVRQMQENFGNGLGALAMIMSLQAGE